MKDETLFALVDCNNFYVSCERVFQPRLEKKPVLVLSSNDGCVVARSNESKALGIPMGTACFKIKDIIQKHNVILLSSNFELYNDMSNRVMNILSGFAPATEIYSIDEAFLDLSTLQKNAFDYSKDLSKRILQWTGLPVSIGLGPTKTLAKLANYIAKHQRIASGVFDLSDEKARVEVLKNISVSDLWGVGYKTAQKLSHMGIDTALQLYQTDPKRIHRKTNINLMRTVLELQGVSSLEIEDSKPQKQILVSRSFGQRFSDLLTLKSALSTHVSSAARKLRQQASLAQAVLVFLQTVYANRTSSEPHHSVVLPLPFPSSDTKELIATALEGLSQIYSPKLQYRKCGIMLLDLRPNTMVQNDMFQEKKQNPRSDLLMQTFDEINQRMGRRTVHYAVEDLQKNWQPKSSLRTPAYTTSWNEIPFVK